LEVYAENCTLLRLTDQAFSTPVTEAGDKIAKLKLEVGRMGSWTNLIKCGSVTETTLKSIERDNNENFGDLIQFFQARTRRQSPHPIYTSMIINEAGTNGRLGMEAVLRAVLP